MPEISTMFLSFRDHRHFFEWTQPADGQFMGRTHSKLPTFQVNFAVNDLPFGRDQLQLTKFGHLLILDLYFVFVLHIGECISGLTGTHPDPALSVHQIPTIDCLQGNLVHLQVEVHVHRLLSPQLHLLNYYQVSMQVGRGLKNLNIYCNNLKMLQYFSQERGIEDNTYTSEDFLFRWRKLERVLTKEGVDGLLLATGLDAKDSIHSAYLFNWLFLGQSGKSITINKYLDPIYSEIVAVISPKGSHIFITPQARDALQTLIYSLPNCTVFCPTDKEYNNKELLDTLKIAHFYGVTHQVGKIGVFLGDSDDAKIIEKWPIIQSYALEPVGRTFFTLQHQAVNLGAKISALFRNLDKHSLKNLVSRTAYSMEGHVRGSLMSVELKSQAERQQISQKTIQQSLQEAVDIGLFESGAEEYKGNVRVLFGTRTQSAPGSQPTATIQSEKAEHLTIEHFDPYTKMKIWRTYFLNLNKKNNSTVQLAAVEAEDSFLVNNLYRISETPNNAYDKQRCLVSIYTTLVQAVLQSISAVSKDYRNLNSEFISKLVIAKINGIASQIYGKEVFGLQDLETEVESFDSFGEARPIDFKDSISFKLTSTFYVLKIKLKNIKDPGSQADLGAVIFSESFLIQEGCYLLLTKRCPYFDFWKCSSGNELLDKLNPNFEFPELGKMLSPEGFRNRIFIPCQKLSAFHLNIPVLETKLFFHKKGLRIFSDKIGWETLLYADIADSTMVNKIPGEWVLVKTKKSFLFDCLENNVLAIEFRGKPFQFLIKQTKDKQNPIELSFIDSIPPLLSENWYFCSEILKKPVKEGAVMYQHQILTNDFLWSFIEAKQLMIVQMKDIKMSAFKNLYQIKAERRKEQTEASGKHGILLINGAYGAGKLRLAQNIKRFGPNQLKCQIFRVPSDNLFDKISPESFIEMLEEFITENQISQDVKIITILPSWLNNAQCIPLLGQKFHIHSVLTKINAANFFSTNNLNLVENVLTFCLPGYSQNIVVDAFADEESLINNVIKIVGSFNRETRVARSTNCILTTGQCIDILTDTSYKAEYQTFLRQKYGAFYSFDQLNELSLNFIDFKFPLYDLKGLERLHKSEGYLIDRAAILKELEPKKRQAQNSKDDLLMGLYFLEEVMSVVRRRKKVPQIRSIKAIVKVKQQGKQTELKEINWANFQYQVNDCKDQSRQLGFSIISRNYDEVEVKKFIEGLSYKKVLFGDSMPVKTIDSLSEQEISEIEKWAIEGSKFMENGEYYDGYVLRNAQGYLIDRHPNLQKAIQGWIKQRNETAVQHNASLKEKWNDYIVNYKQE